MLNSGFAIKSNKVRVTNSRLPQSIFKTVQPSLVLFVSLQWDFACVLALPLTSPVTLRQVASPLRSPISSVKWDNDPYLTVFSSSKCDKAQTTQRLSHRWQPLKDVSIIIIVQDCAECCPVFCSNMSGLSSRDGPCGTSPPSFPPLWVMWEEVHAVLEGSPPAPLWAFAYIPPLSSPTMPWEFKCSQDPRTPSGGCLGLHISQQWVGCLIWSSERSRQRSRQKEDNFGGQTPPFRSQGTQA